MPKLNISKTTESEKDEVVFLLTQNVAHVIILFVKLVELLKLKK